LRLINKLFESREEFTAEQEDLGIEFSGSALSVLTAEIEVPEKRRAGENPHALYASTVDLVREKLEKLFPCYTAALDTRHFVIVFCLEDTDSGAQRGLLEGELRNTIAMVHNYFNVRLRMALGFPVEDPLRLHESCLAARQAFEETGPAEPLRFFEHQNYQLQMVAGVRDYIRRNLDKRLSLQEVAAVFNFSPNYLSQIFTKYAGEGFVEYTTAEKIRAAREMLIRGEGAIYEIAGRLGYESAFYFSKVFKKVEGISPREFLRRLEH
jgi:two-component system response regulator YesN